MPITPLHIGVLAPINHVVPGKVSAASFILTQVFLDRMTIIFYLMGYGDVDHSNHTLYGALAVAALVGLIGFCSASWVWGAFIGAFSHVILDAFVHTDVFLLGPWIEGNLLYMGWMKPLSLILLVLSVWWLLQITSSVLKGRVVCRVQGDTGSTSNVPSSSKVAGADRLLSSLYVRQWRWNLFRGAVLLAIAMLDFAY